jgi:biotin carboxyl carrier protein
MRYFTTLRGEERSIDIERLEEGRYRMTIQGGAPRIIDARHLEGHVVHMLVDNASHEVDIEEESDTLAVQVDGAVFRFDLLDERRMRLRKAGGKFHVAGPQTVRAPMPGKIVKVLVAKGAAVTEGQGVVIIEAMKMENELRAPKAGQVAEIFVSEGQTVEHRADLVSIE